LDPDLPTTRPLNISCFEEKTEEELNKLDGITANTTGSMITGDWHMSASITSNKKCPDIMASVTSTVENLQDLLDDINIFLTLEEPPSCYSDYDPSDYDYESGEQAAVQVELQVARSASAVFRSSVVFARSPSWPQMRRCVSSAEA